MGQIQPLTSTHVAREDGVVAELMLPQTGPKPHPCIQPIWQPLQLARWGEDNPSELLIAGLESLLVYVHQQYRGDIGQWLQALCQETD